MFWLLLCAMSEDWALIFKKIIKTPALIWSPQKGIQGPHESVKEFKGQWKMVNDA
jgi:hypothetical protein